MSTTTGVSTALNVNEVTVRFGGIVALDAATLEAGTGEITGLIGPNGAGKTTLFNCLTGIYRAHAGSIEFNGTELLGKAPHEVAKLGISRTFQNLALFSNLTVRDNVMVGVHRVRRTSWIENALRLPSVLSEERTMRDRVDAAIDEVGLMAYADELAAGMPYGILKRIELARAIAAEPALLLLDEPAAGLTHGEVDGLMNLIRSMRDARGLSIVLVEHNMGLVMRLCDQVTVLNFGRTIAAGPPSEVSQNPDVIEAYLGTPA